MRFRPYMGNVRAFGPDGAFALQTNGAMKPEYWQWDALTPEQEFEMEAKIDEQERLRA